MIRKAVGAIVYDGRQFLLAQRVMIEAGKSALEKIQPEWDIIKGGLNVDESPEMALLRELFEETGSKDFRIEKKYDEPIRFSFPEKICKSTGWESQETVIFLVRYVGNYIFHPSEEIGEIKFFNKEQAIKLLQFKETKEFFKKFAP
jgi:putative (di)nucleoside polyphosphate hydrolase